jgi:hypothetical protein
LDGQIGDPTDEQTIGVQDLLAGDVADPQEFGRSAAGPRAIACQSESLSTGRPCR